MTGQAAIGVAHWIYLAGVVAIVVTMIMRANVVVPSVVATFLVTFAWTGSPATALGGIFNASFTAAKELFNIFLVIALMTALLAAQYFVHSRPGVCRISVIEGGQITKRIHGDGPNWREALLDAAYKLLRRERRWQTLRFGSGRASASGCADYARCSTEQRLSKR